MEVRLDGTTAVVTLLRDSYLADDAEALRRELKEFSDGRPNVAGVEVDASRVTGYLAVTIVKSLWDYARFQGGLALRCSREHVAAHVARFFPSVTVSGPGESPAKLRLAA